MNEKEKENNYIIAEFDIKNDNQNIRIINTYEQYMRATKNNNTLKFRLLETIFIFILQYFLEVVTISFFDKFIIFLLLLLILNF